MKRNMLKKRVEYYNILLEEFKSESKKSKQDFTREKKLNFSKMIMRKRYDTTRRYEK
jgi:hypothetical protein